MAYLIWVFFFEAFYLAIYFVVPLVLLDAYFMYIEKYIPYGLNIIIIILGLIVLLLGAIASYSRSRIAAGCKVNSKMKLLEANNSSLAILKAQIEYLPIFGKIYHKFKRRNKTNKE